jgi:hypothetical protein
MYIDAGSGSMIVSAIVAGTAGVSVLVKRQWRRMTGALRRTTDADTAVSSNPPQEP